MKVLRNLAVAAVMGSASAASAASVNVGEFGYNLGSTTLSLSGQRIEIADPLGLGLGLELTVGDIFSPVVFSFDPADPTQYALAFFHPDGTALDGLLGASAISAMDGLISLLFEGIMLTGDLVGTGSGAVLVEIEAESGIEVELDPRTRSLLFTEGTTETGGIVSVTTLDVIPLPATLPMILGALGVLGLIRRRRAAA